MQLKEFRALPDDLLMLEQDEKRERSKMTREEEKARIADTVKTELETEGHPYPFRTNFHE